MGFDDLSRRVYEISIYACEDDGWNKTFAEILKLNKIKKATRIRIMMSFLIC